MNTSTEYMNGGVTSNIVKLAMEGGYNPTADELLTIAAHEAMPRNVFYTDEQLRAKREEIAAYADRTMPNWRKDEYLDLYGVPTPSPRPKRMSAYDRKHTTRK